jgi:alpha-glucosidase
MPTHAGTRSIRAARGTMRAAGLAILAAGSMLLGQVPSSAPEPAHSRSVSFRSPDGRTSVAIDAGSTLRFAIDRAGARVLEPSTIGLTVDGRPLGTGTVRETARTRADRQVETVFYPRRATVRDRYEQLTLVLDSGLSVVFRAYDDAVAYRLVTSLDGRVRVDAETLALRFPGAPLAYLPFADCAKAARNGADCFHTSFEEPYAVGALASTPRDRQAFLPVLVDGGEGRPKVLLTESDLDDYPGAWVRAAADAPNGLDGLWAAYPIEERVVGEGFPQAIVARRAAYLAETSGTRAFPWRILAIADRDAELPATDVVYRLGGETRPGDWSWLRPGKSQSEWLWDNILYDVPFVSGLNTDTYRSYIDFADTFHTGYLFFDAGWSKVMDPLSITPGRDGPAREREARAKGRGVERWHLALAVDRHMDAVMDQLHSWGATGIMVDFMDRDDQRMVQFYRRVVEAAAARHLLVNFHGAYKPTGLERQLPNAVTREAVIAFEYDKWSDVLTPEYEVTLPFVRGVAGPIDYEPGSMRNAQREAFKPMGALPVSQGTRMHQAAMYLLYDSPYAKMGGNVSDYRREPAFTTFLAAIPTLWADTRVLDGRIGDYIVVRRDAKDGSYWLAAMTDWSPRDLDVPLGFLPGGAFAAELWEDGPNAARYGADWAKRVRTVTAADRLAIHLAPGGGWVAHLTNSRP